MRDSIRTLWVLLVLVVLATAAFAQTTGTIRGIATDHEGSALPGVTITVSVPDRGTSRTAVTGESGRFAFPALAVDTYNLSAVLEGFQEQEVADIRVGIAATVMLEIVMPLGSVTDTITVSSAPVLDRTSSSVSTDFTIEMVTDLPTQRYFYDLLAVTPGVSQQSEGSDALTVFGSSTQSNSWSVDGQDATNVDTGRSYWWINPDTIEEIQALSIGAPAQFGNMSGGAFNVVTKSGTNDFKGSLTAFVQGPNLTDENVEIDGIPFNRDEFLDFSATLGGPIKRDKVWFFAAYQNFSDTFSDPGVDPAFPTLYPSIKYDVKLNAAINQSTLMDAKYHFEDWEWEYGDAFSTPSAQGNQGGGNPAWGIGFDTVLNEKNLLEIGYAGWRGDEHWRSRTGSTEDPFIDRAPPGGGPWLYSGGLYFPYQYDLGRDQADITLSTHADEFLKGDHEFKFGVAYGQGFADTVTTGGPQGRYYYRQEYTFDYYGYEYTYLYYYRVTARAYHYGADSETLSAFVDDSWQITPKLTLNLGLRFDQINSDIPDFAKLDRFSNETGETIPGLKDAVDWSLWSPRLGFAWQTGQNGVLRGFYGKFYDQNVTGNWYAPPPDAPSYLYQYSLSPDGPWEGDFLWTQSGTTVDPNLKAPETDQFSLGYERQVGTYYTVGIQGVYKTTKNLIGFEILGDGEYEMLPWINPFTGELTPIASIIEEPSRWKGNRPGEGSLAEPGAVFEQDFQGVVLSFNRPFRKGWGMMASYTYSKSTGLLPDPLSENQGDPFYTTRNGSDPNNWINSKQALQNERRHVVQLQGSYDLPWKLRSNVVYRFLDGKPYGRHLTVGQNASLTPLNQGSQTVIAIPADSSTTRPDQHMLDITLGRAFTLGPVDLLLDLQLYNAFNTDTHDYWETLNVPPGDVYTPSSYVFPRRLQLRVGLRF